MLDRTSVGARSGGAERGAAKQRSAVACSRSHTTPHQRRGAREQRAGGRTDRRTDADGHRDGSDTYSPRLARLADGVSVSGEPPWASGGAALWLVRACGVAGCPGAPPRAPRPPIEAAAHTAYPHSTSTAATATTSAAATATTSALHRAVACVPSQLSGMCCVMGAPFSLARTAGGWGAARGSRAAGRVTARQGGQVSVEAREGVT